MENKTDFFIMDKLLGMLLEKTGRNENGAPINLKKTKSSNKKGRPGGGGSTARKKKSRRGRQSRFWGRGMKKAAEGMADGH